MNLVLSHVAGSLLLGFGVAQEHDLSLFVSCRADLTGRYSPVGYTAAGTPYYGSDSGFYLFHDPSCDGTEDQAARWVLDVDAPSTEAFQDLDQDGKCAYQARLNGGNASAPPSTALWTVFCGGSWQEEEVLVTEDRGNHYQQECFEAGACRDGGSTPCEWCGLHQGQRLFCCSASDENPEYANCSRTPELDFGASFRCVTTTTTTPAADRYLSGCGSHCEDGSPCAWCGLHDQKEMFCCSEKEYSVDQACRKADWSSRGDASGQPVCVPQTPPHKAFAEESTSSGVLMASVLTAAILLVLLVVGISFILRRSTKRQEEELQQRVRAKKEKKSTPSRKGLSGDSGDPEIGSSSFASTVPVPVAPAMLEAASDGFPLSL
ncbi:unnamed protein product [Symbiodinium sp. CCMP2592]|nr:unnamed protein product [Symbiodinium sp. CCMP2592]